MRDKKTPQNEADLTKQSELYSWQALCTAQSGRVTDWKDAVRNKCKRDQARHCALHSSALQSMLYAKYAQSMEQPKLDGHYRTSL